MIYYSWSLAPGGDWFATGGWSPAGPPGGVDASAQLLLPGSYTVSLAVTDPFVLMAGFFMNAAHATFDLAGTMVVAGEFNVQNGTLREHGGGRLLSLGTATAIGGVAGEAAAVTVDGLNTTWTIADTDLASAGVLAVGDTGRGALTISNGGSLLDGNDLLVGGYGAGTGTMSILSGGFVSTGGTYTTIGGGTGSHGTVLVSGSRTDYVDSDGTHTVGSTWSVGRSLIVGNGGTGSLTIADGGTVDVLGLRGDPSLDVGSVIGKHVGAGHSKLSVSGVGSVFVNANRLDVGWSTGGTLDVSAGGLAILSQTGGGNHALRLGNGSGGAGVVTVRGGTIEANGRVEVGSSDGKGTLAISAGGTLDVVGNGLEDSAFTVGINGTGKSSGVVTVTGAGSLLRVLGAAYVGQSEGTGKLTVAAGASFVVTSVNQNQFPAIIGVDAGATGEIDVTGQASTWRINSYAGLDVGLSGKGTLKVLAGGSVTANQSLYAGYNAGSTGSVTIDGTGSTLTANHLYLGVNYDGAVPVAGGTGTLTATNGGAARFSAVTAFIFTGSAIHVDKTGKVEIGGSGHSKAGQLLIDAGATLTGAGRLTASVADGGLLTATGGTLVVAGALSGSGTASIAAGARLELGGAVGTGDKVLFGADATLQLDAAASFKGKLGDIVAGDTIVFKNLALSSAAFIGSTLSLKLAAGGTETLALTAPVLGLQAGVSVAAGVSTLLVTAAAMAPAPDAAVALGYAAAHPALATHDIWPLHSAG